MMDVFVLKTRPISPSPWPSSHSSKTMTHRSFMSSISSVTIPSPAHHLPVHAAVPILDELTNEFIRLNLSKWTSQWKMAVLLEWCCREVKRILQNTCSACVCDYMNAVELHDISVCYSDVWSKTSVFWTSFGAMDVDFLIFQPSNEKWPWSSSCVWGKGRRLRE
jgi:hypothetical protein